MANIQLVHPQSHAELLNALSKADVQTVIVAGGTDTTVKMRSVGFYQGTLIDLSGMQSLKYIQHTDEEVQIGALATLSMIEKSDLVKKYCPALGRAAGMVGSTQIRNLGTLPGNLCNASPCADTVPALMAYGAKAKVMNAKGEIDCRELDAIIYGQGRNLLEPGEIILEIGIPKEHKDWLYGYQKIGSRKAVTIAKLNGCVLVNTNNNQIVDAAVYAGSLGIKAFKAIRVEQSIIGAELNEELAVKLFEGLDDTVDEAIKGRSSYPYKKDAVRGLADDLATQLLSLAKKGVISNDAEIRREILSSS